MYQYIYIYTYIYKYILSYTCICVYTNICPYIYTYIYAHTHFIFSVNRVCKTPMSRCECAHARTLGNKLFLGSIFQKLCK